MNNKTSFKESEVFLEFPMEKQLNKDELCLQISKLFNYIELYKFEEKVELINQIRIDLSSHSPFKQEPVDCVQWVKSEQVRANEYNPNTVAPPEMELLKLSIEADGYTQPIVSMKTKKDYEVIDGFHRNRVGKECESIKERIKGYLPVVTIRHDRENISDRMASTIRHNRARGKHKVEAMSDIVVELKNRNWTNERIAKNLGMDEDEVLRLCQITGLSDLFKDEDFSKSWDVEGHVSEADFQELTDDVSTYGEYINDTRVVNSDDENRIFHTYKDWECYRAGFYETTKEGMTKEQCEIAYRDFLINLPKFEESLNFIIKEWKNSCEHYLTNSAMNRIAWLGQAALCYSENIPSTFRSGFNLLTENQQLAANEVALKYLNKWLVRNNRPEVTMDEAISHGRQSDIY